MNCLEWEESIALYMGNDIGQEEAAAVERHLAECAGCQMFASGMRESLAVLHEAHAAELGTVAYAAVRARVLGELEARPARRWFFGLAAVAAAAAMLAALWMRPAKHITVAHRDTAAPKEVVLAAPVMPQQPVIVPAVRAQRHRRPVATKPLPVAAPLPEKPLVVKLVTDDPNVVIYWITDTRGE